MLLQGLLSYLLSNTKMFTFTGTVKLLVVKCDKEKTAREIHVERIGAEIAVFREIKVFGKRTKPSSPPLKGE